MYSKIVSSLFRGRDKDKKSGVVSPEPGPAPSHQPSGHNRRVPEEDCDNYYDMPPSRALTWNVRYTGSFPISNTNADHVSFRLERFQPCGPARPVCLSVSLVGVRVNEGEDLILSHSLRRVCSVIGRSNVRQVAYIALEPTGQMYRRQCHVFATDDAHQVEEIEAVLGNAFQHALMARQISTPVLPPKPSGMATSTPIPALEKRASSSAFLSRLLGKREEVEGKKRRRPVSAVFSHALHRLSGTAIAHKRMSTVDVVRGEEEEVAAVSSRASLCPPPLPTVLREENEDEGSGGSTSGVTGSGSDRTPSPTLMFDEKLAEWVYPIDEFVEQQLVDCSYFVKNATRELVMRNLLARPEGSFIVRLSESRRRCLALSVRVAFEHNDSGIAHYMIIRNEQGFRIKGFSRSFPTLPALINYHSVMPELLPCTLQFTLWTKQDWTVEEDRSRHRLSSSAARGLPSNLYEPRRRCDPSWEEVRSSRLLDGVLLDLDQTPRRRSRHMYRHSRLIEMV